MEKRYVTFIDGVIWNVTKRKANAAKFEKKVLDRYPHYEGRIATEVFE